jgi:hypothetical protein
MMMTKQVQPKVQDKPASKKKRAGSVDKKQQKKASPEKERPQCSDKMRPATPAFNSTTPKPSPMVSKVRYASKTKVVQGNHPVPKRPRTSYVYFCTEFLSKLDANDGALPIT